MCMLGNAEQFIAPLTREELLDKWVEIEDPKPTWEDYSKLVGMTNINIDKVLDLWRRKKPTVQIKGGKN